jgi:PAS domain S-box-containing protein
VDVALDAADVDQVGRLFFELAPDPVIVTDENGSMVAVNAAVEATFGYTRDELVGQPVELLVPDHRRQAHVEARARFVREQVGYARMATGPELYARRRDGSSFPVDVTLNRVPLKEGGGFLCIIRDMTAPRAMEVALAEERARRAEKIDAFGRLAAGMAHDFNNLLGVIRGLSEQLLRALDPSSPAFATAQELCAAVDRSAGLTGELMGVARRSESPSRETDLSEAVRGTMALVERLVDGRAAISWDLAPERLLVGINATHVMQIVTNLVTNARDAMAGRVGTIRVRTERRDLDGRGVAVLLVEDEGCGMDEPTRQALFDPFRTTKGARGTGIGLCGVRAIVHEHGGEISVTSAIDRGTTIEVRLPILPILPILPRLASASPGRSQPDAAAATSGPTVLVIEDDEQLMRIVSRMLAAHGIRALPCSDAGTARQVFAAYRSTIDAVLSDVDIDGVSGRDLGSELAQQRPGLKTIFMSGVAVAGVDLVKPFSAAQLIEVIRNAVAPERATSG